MKKIKDRTVARDYAFKYLYHVHFLSEGHLEGIDEKRMSDFQKSYLEQDNEHPDNQLNTQILDFADQMIRGVIESQDELKKIIGPYLKKRTINDLDSADLSILLIGVYELVHMKSTPVKVVINEAVNMSKKFGKQRSYSFINGILDRISKADFGGASGEK